MSSARNIDASQPFVAVINHRRDVIVSVNDSIELAVRLEIEFLLIPLRDRVGIVRVLYEFVVRARSRYVIRPGLVVNLVAPVLVCYGRGRCVLGHFQVVRMRPISAERACGVVLRIIETLELEVESASGNGHVRLIEGKVAGGSVHRVGEDSGIWIAPKRTPCTRNLPKADRNTAACTAGCVTGICERDRNTVAALRVAAGVLK